tara:strand:+ start:328 stop:2253 length:1926 start_codon:yes stop_codon:yes gene_type:complete
MGEKYAFSSMLHLVWAVVLVLGMGFVHFYMSMIATSFDPCPENQADANLKASIDKSTKYFNDIKMIHLGIACAIILTMLIGKAIVPRDGKTVCSIVTIVLKLAACLIVVFGVSHAQNILKLRNKQCNNSIDEVKMRELKILIEACIGSIGVIIGNYLSLGINNLISFKMPSSMSIIITTVVCILLVFSIIGGDALINIFKKELNIKNECVALNEELSKVDVSIGPANNILGGILPDRLQLSGDKTYKDLNAGKTVIKGDPVIVTEDHDYTPDTTQNIVIENLGEQILKNKAIRIIFPSDFKNVEPQTVTLNGITGNNANIEAKLGENNSLFFVFTQDVDITINDGASIKYSNIKLPNTLGFTEPIKLEILSVPDGDPTKATVEQVSYNNYFDLKDDNFITFDSLNITKVTKMTVRTKLTDVTKLEHGGDGLIITIPEGLYYPELKQAQPIKIFRDKGHSSDSSGKPSPGKEYTNYEVIPEGESVAKIQRFDGSTPNGYKQFKIIKNNIKDDNDVKGFHFKFTVPILTTQKPIKFATFELGHNANGDGDGKITHNHPIEFIDPKIQEDTKCPVLSRDLFMKIFLTSVMTGWAVSSIVYLSGDLYEYNSSNMALLLAGAGGGVDTATTAAAAAAAAAAATQNA